MVTDDSDRLTDRVFIGVFEPLDLVTDLLWIWMAVETGPFTRTSEFAVVLGLAWGFFVLNVVRYLNARRSRSAILAAGLEGTHGARFREVIYAAQQVVWEDMPAIILGGYVAARLVVAGTFNQWWPAVSIVSILMSEVSFIKFGRAISRAGFRPERDPLTPMLLLAFMPPGLRDKSDDEPVPTVDRRLFGVARRFNDRGDESIEDINALLGSRWL